MIPPMPSYVNIWHNDTYPAINPSRPALSHEGKTIVITGSSDGIGKGIANAYAAAGAAKVVILARREALLVKVKDDIESKYPKTKVSYHVADVIDKDSLDKAAKETGEWHVLVLNAGFQSEHSHPMATADAQDWWKGFEVSLDTDTDDAIILIDSQVNIFGAFLSIQAFMPTRASKAAVVGISSGVVSMPGSAMLNSTSYQSSKMGLAKVLETFAAENLDMHVGIIHPGVVATDMLEKSEMGDSLPIDTGK